MRQGRVLGAGLVLGAVALLLWDQLDTAAPESKPIAPLESKPAPVRSEPDKPAPAVKPAAKAPESAARREPAFALNEAAYGQFFSEMCGFDIGSEADTLLRQLKLKEAVEHFEQRGRNGETKAFGWAALLRYRCALTQGKFGPLQDAIDTNVDDIREDLERDTLSKAVRERMSALTQPLLEARSAYKQACAALGDDESSLLQAMPNVNAEDFSEPGALDRSALGSAHRAVAEAQLRRDQKAESDAVISYVEKLLGAPANVNESDAAWLAEALAEQLKSSVRLPDGLRAQALERLTAYAEADQVPAIGTLAGCYERGCTNIPQDIDGAGRWFTRKAELGEPEALRAMMHPGIWQTEQTGEEGAKTLALSAALQYQQAWQAGAYGRTHTQQWDLRQSVERELALRADLSEEAEREAQIRAAAWLATRLPMIGRAFGDGCWKAPASPAGASL